MDSRRLWLMVLTALWVMVWGGSFVAFVLTEPAGEDFVRGFNRVATFLGWQGIAGVLAIAIWGVGRGWRRGSPPRRLSRVPLTLAILLLLAILALMGWAVYAP